MKSLACSSPMLIHSSAKGKSFSSIIEQSFIYEHTHGNTSFQKDAM